jgi:3',5'-cyclic AMP phosphodiesterase CpdA
MDDQVRFIHITDTHIGPSPDYMLYHANPFDQTQALIKHLNEDLPFVPDFVLHTGDVAYNPNDPQAYHWIAQTFNKLKYPCYYVRGNHDDADLMRQTLPHLPSGQGRIDYDFIVNDFHFVVLDSFGRNHPRGYLEDYQLTWLGKTCRESQARSLVIVVHHLPYLSGYTWFEEQMVIENHTQLFEILKPFKDKIRGLFFGHVHRASCAVVDGIFCATPPSASLAFFPWTRSGAFEPDPDTHTGYNIVTLTHHGVSLTQYNFPLLKP